MSSQINSIIIDDESLARSIVKKYLTSHKKIKIIAECSNGFEALKIINEKKPNLIFLDIQMPKLNGFELLDLLDEPPVIIFTTAYDQYAIKAFEANAVDYLLKPFSQKRFDEAVDKALYSIQSNSKNLTQLEKLKDSNYKEEEWLERIVVKDGAKILVIPLHSLNFLEAQDDYVMINAAEGKFLKQKTMKYFEENLPPSDFLRIHRSYIVPIKKIKKISLREKSSYQIELNSGELLPLSRSGYLKLKEILEQ